jgi:hypothetical protein
VSIRNEVLRLAEQFRGLAPRPNAAGCHPRRRMKFGPRGGTAVSRAATKPWPPDTAWTFAPVKAICTASPG